MEQKHLTSEEENKIRGSLYGFLIGDAMGATTEFLTTEAIKRRYGRIEEIIGGGWLNLAPGETTDDTEMTIAVIDALVSFEGGLDSFVEQCAINFSKWLKTNPKDVGGQCLKGIEAIQRGERVQHDPTALGNGSLMRALPCALINRLDYNHGQGRLTHHNAKCDNAIRTYSYVLNELLIRPSGDRFIDPPAKTAPRGHVEATLNNALHHSLGTDSFEESITNAVNDGGDSDTIAAITGSLSGMRWGYDSIPQTWIDQLNQSDKQKVEDFADFVMSHRWNTDQIV